MLCVLAGPPPRPEGRRPTVISRLLDRVAFFLFGMRDPEARTPRVVPGNGTHGGSGGQSPPLVPYSRDWDPENRIT
jgi:hypothetical protein